MLDLGVTRFVYSQMEKRAEKAEARVKKLEKRVTYLIVVHDGRHGNSLLGNLGTFAEELPKIDVQVMAEKWVNKQPELSFNYEFSVAAIKEGCIGQKLEQVYTNHGGGTMTGQTMDVYLD